MELDDRKLKILQAVIDDYISSGEPVGSRSIVRKYDMDLSPATIRNEMADLEEMGYLEQPHTSAGRIPSDKGYRLYVDQMLKPQKARIEDITMMTQILETRIDELSYMLQRATRLLSQITGYPTIAMAPKEKSDTIKKVQIFPVDSEKALVVVNTSSGAVHNNVIRIPAEISEEEIANISDRLCKELFGLSIEQIDIKLANELSSRDGISAEALLPILHGIIECISRIDEHSTYTGGVKNVLEYPEFSETYRAKELISMIEEKGFISDVIQNINTDTDEGDGLVVSIGSENVNDKIKDCTIVTSSYDIGDNHRVVMGVIGPTRMDYAKVISVMKDMRIIMGNQKKELHELSEGKNNKIKKDKEGSING